MDQPTEPLPLFEEARLRVRIFPGNLGYLRQPRMMVPPLSIRIDASLAAGQDYTMRPWAPRASTDPVDLRVTLSPQNRLWLVATLEGLAPLGGYELLPGSFSVRASASRVGIDIHKDAVADLAHQLAPVFPDHRILFRLFPRLAAGLVQFRDEPPYRRVLIAL